MRLSADFRKLCFLLAFTSGPVLGQTCLSDADCSNNVYCDGFEYAGPAPLIPTSVVAPWLLSVGPTRPAARARGDVGQSWKISMAMGT